MFPDVGKKFISWLRVNAVSLLIGAALVLVCLVPIISVLFPQLTDLQQHILVSKLLWEELTGVSRLDLEVSGYLGYRLSSYLIVVLLAVCNAVGISLIYLPKLVASTFLAAHVAIVAWTFFKVDKVRTLGSALLRTGLALPAAVAMYSACWFIGFVGYTLAISILVLAIFVTEAYLESGRRRDLVWLFILLALVYMAHPFALVFWALWCAARGLASVLTWVITAEWKRFLLLPIIPVPIALYDYFVRTPSGHSPNRLVDLASFFVESSEWYTNRFHALLKGTYFKGDEVAHASWFAYFLIGFVLAAPVVAVISRIERRVWATSLSAILFAAVASMIGEKFFPVPQGHWLAYNYRFASTAAVVCLSVAGWVILRSVQQSTRSRGLIWAASCLALVATLSSAIHLNSVRSAYRRFDTPATEYVQKLMNFERPIGIVLPRSDWYPDITFLRRYTCLTMPDCDPAGTLFRNLGGDVYPVQLMSTKRQWPDDMRTDINAFKGGEGYLPGQYSWPRGIAADQHGNFAVADTGNQRVQVFDSGGKFVWWVGEIDGSPLAGPKAVAFDAAGRLYVLDGLDLLRFRADRSFDKRWTGKDAGLMEPTDLAIDESGILFIVDQTRGSVTRFDPQTEKFARLNKIANNALSRPTGIAVAGDQLYIADSGNDRIQVLDRDGSPVRQWEVSAWAKYMYHYPDVAVDPTRNRVYVTSGWTREIFVFDTNGKSIGKLVLPPGTESNNPSAIALSRANDRLYLLGNGSKQLDNGDPGVVALDPGA